MRNRNALKCSVGVVVAALFLAVTWSTTAARLSAITTTGSAVKPNAVALNPNGLMASSMAMAPTNGHGRVTVTTSGSCLDQTPPHGNGPFDWEVVQGGSYIMTISGVTECTGPAITVFVQSTDNGNFCFNATGAAGTYVGSFTMPANACNTFPISYKCGADQACNNSNTFNAQGPNGEDSVHLRAATFDGNCTLTGADTDCTGSGQQGCTISVAPPDQDLGCNPTSFPGSEQTVTGTCNGASVTPTFSSSESDPAGCIHTRTNTWTIVCGAQTCAVSQTLTYKTDTTKPVLSGVPTGGDLGCNPTPPSCSAGVTANDDCDGTVQVNCTPGTVTGTCNKSQTFTYSATDSCGNIASQDVTYTWKDDTTKPVFSGLPAGGNLGCNPTPPTCGEVTANDNCDGSVNVTCTAGAVTGPDCAKSQTFTYSATDSCHNTATETVTYTWKVDHTAPVLSGVPTGGSLGCNPATLPTCSTGVTANDNCDGPVQVTCTPGSIQSSGCNRSQSFTYSATDSCNNPASQTVTYTWREDLTPPTIGNPGANATIFCPSTPSFTPPTAVDGCGGAQVVQAGDDVTVTAGFSCGTKTVTRSWYAVDECGNRSNTVRQTITVECNNCGGLTMGFWQNKNGQAIITASPSPGLRTFLLGFNPFMDLSPTATPAAVATYVTNVIKAANASGAAMNAMLKAQMLATALDVYFSDPALGGNKINAPAPLGAVKIDLTHINKPIGSGTYEDTTAAFGGGSCQTVSALLSYASSQSNTGGTVWYGQVKATQELAKDTFDAINNNVAFSCP